MKNGEGEKKMEERGEEDGDEGKIGGGGGGVGERRKKEGGMGYVEDKWRGEIHHFSVYVIWHSVICM